MIIITTQIETDPQNSGISAATAIDSRHAAPKEEYVAEIFKAALEAATEHLMETHRSGNLMVGGEGAKELLKARLKAKGIKYEGTPIAKALARK